MREAGALLPDHAEIATLTARTEALLTGACARSIDQGATATDPAAVAAAQAEFIQHCEPQFPALVGDMSGARQALLDLAGKAQVALADAAQTTILLTYAIVFCGLALVMGVAFFAVRAWIIVPLQQLQATMDMLSGGNYDVEVGAVLRRDEIGAMARSVELFKTAGIERLRLSTKAKTMTDKVEADRVWVEAVRAELARQQEFVVISVAAGLENLSKGNLLYRLETPFSHDYEKLRQDFNSAMQTLQSTMRAIAIAQPVGARQFQEGLVNVIHHAGTGAQPGAARPHVTVGHAWWMLRPGTEFLADK